MDNGLKFSRPGGQLFKWDRPIRQNHMRRVMNFVGLNKTIQKESSQSLEDERFLTTWFSTIAKAKIYDDSTDRDYFIGKGRMNFRPNFLPENIRPLVPANNNGMESGLYLDGQIASGFTGPDRQPDLVGIGFPIGVLLSPTSQQHAKWPEWVDGLMARKEYREIISKTIFQDSKLKERYDSWKKTQPTK